MNNILLYIKDEIKNFSKTEYKLAKFILEYPENVLNMSIKELSEKTSVSSATIVRFCRNIGIDGYGDFKIQLSSNLSSIKDKTYSEIEKNEDIYLILNKLETRFQHNISSTKNLIDKNVLNNCINILHNASQIQTFGIGASALIAQDIYQKFVRLGFHIVHNIDYHVATTCLSVSDENAVFIGISHSGNTKEVVKLLNIAKNKGIKTITITSDINSLVCENTDYILLTEKSGEAPLRIAATTSIIGQLFVVDALFFSYVSTYYDEILKNLKISKETINSIRNKG